MKIINLKLSELKPYENNPRINDEAVEYVAESIKQFGFRNPIIIDKDNVIIAGHTRFRASKRLGLKEVPCIRADDLTDEQVKAFRLADNKVAEISEWDYSMLDKELAEIEDIDMEDFGFDIDLDIETSGIEDDFKENERERTNNAYNLALYDETLTDGKYQIPIIQNDNFIPKDIISFNYAKTSNQRGVGIHFYIDDYQFERIWNNPEDYIDTLNNYDCIFSPDFSLYMDMPMAMKIWNVYRSRLIGQYYQQRGIKVIPTLSWAEKETFEFCFDGIPKGSIVSVSTVGVRRSKEAMQIWKDGMDAMIEKIEPTIILVYGDRVEYDYKDIEVIYFENKITKNMKEASKNGD